MNNKTSMQIFRASPSGPPQQFTPDTIKRLEKQINNFKIFMKALTSNYTDTKKTYYLLSTKFIRQWRKYSGYDARQAGNPFPATGIRPNAFNQDIIQISNDLVYDQESNSVYSYILRPELSEKIHFLIIPEELMTIFRSSYDGFCLPRRLLYYNASKKYQIQVHMPRVKFIVLSQQLIPFFKSKIDKLPIMSANISRTAKVIQWKKQIARYWIKGYLKNIKFNQKSQILNAKQIRIWQIENNQKITQYFTKIKKQLVPNEKGNYQIQVEKSKEIVQDEIQFNNLYITNQQIIVIQYVSQKNKQYVFTVKSKSCNNCGKQTALTQICKCGNASYCSVDCRINDQQHLQKCALNSSDQQIKFELTNYSRKGKVGLRNLGNTCYMNSAIQCLSHSKLLTDYFTTYKYQKQINYKNPIGTNGKLVKKYAQTLKNLWFDSKNIYTPSGLKSVIGDAQSMFAGYNQHDSQQFLMFMLDGLHQDLNRVIDKPYIQSKDIQSDNQQYIAKQAWDFYSKRNKSVIIDLFAGQYKSELNCPRCKNKSIKYDIFLNLTLPIPTKENVIFYFMPYGKQSIFNKVQLTIEQPTIQKMRKLFAKQLGNQYDANRLKFMFLNDIIMDASQMNFFQVQQKMISEQLYCIQLTPEEVKHCDNNFNRIIIKFTKTQQPGMKKQILPVSRPFWLNMYTFTIRDLQKILWGWLFKSCVQKNIGMDNVDQAYNKKFVKMDMLPFRFYLRLVQKQIKTFYYKQKTQLISKDKISNILSNLADDTYVQYIECNLDFFNYCDYTKFSTYIAFVPVKSAFQQQKSTTTLYDCFQKFQKPQILTSDNKWNCPKCKQFVCATKSLNLYKSSKYLIIHLKRFKQKSATTKIKIIKFIDIPFKLDLDKYLSNKESPNIDYDITLFSKKQAIYELYAVINHSGNLGGGHYISVAKNNNEWYKFDDDKVKKIQTEDIVTDDAYVLFYQRK